MAAKSEVDDLDFSERYCAFIDILGFRGLIRDLERQKITVREVHRVLSAVHSHRPAWRAEADLKFQSISDAVAISAAPTAAGLDALCTAAEQLSLTSAAAGYFLRGGITKGRLYHDDRMVFGPALVEAYRLESEVAKYPRIIIPRAVASDATGYSRDDEHWKARFDSRFLQASDGPFFVHILRDLSRLSQSLAGRPDKAARAHQLILAKQMRVNIQNRFNEASDNPEHFLKIDWLVSYWNEYMDHGIRNLPAIVAEPL